MTTPLDSFLSHKIKIDDLIARLAALSAEHFGTHPDRLDYGHAGNIREVEDLLKRAVEWAEMSGGQRHG